MCLAAGKGSLVCLNAESGGGGASAAAQWCGHKDDCWRLPGKLPKLLVRESGSKSDFVLELR